MKSDRLFEIIYLLLEKKHLTAKYLAEHFEVSTRTIYRDIESLSISGIPIFMEKGKGGGISILPNFTLDKLILSEIEKSDIILSLKALKNSNIFEKSNVINKVESFLGTNNNEWIEIDFSSWSNGEKEKDNFNFIKTSIFNKQKIQFDYANSKGECLSRKVEPLKLCYKGSSWYLYAYCNIRKEDRFFKLKRINNLISIDENFIRKIPNEIFKKEEFEDEFIDIKLKISEKLAYRVYEEFEVYEKLEDGSFVCEIKYPKGEWMISYINSFGVHGELLEPIELREEIKKQIKKMNEIYF